MAQTSTDPEREPLSPRRPLLFPLLGGRSLGTYAAHLPHKRDHLPSEHGQGFAFTDQE